MARAYALTGVAPDDTTYLNIITDDDDLIQQITLPAYRQSDAATGRLLTAWEEYAAATGSPSTAQDVVQFKDYITATYGSETYRVVQVGG